MGDKLEKSTIIPEHLSGLRLDQVVKELMPEYSRMRISQWIKAAQILVNNEAKRPSDKTYQGDHIAINVNLPVQTQEQAENLPLDIIYEDEFLLIINKPAGLVVHPGAGNRHGTLLNALLHHEPQLNKIPRAGIVHRLDKETSGLLMIAKQLTAHAYLVEQLQQRRISREYQAIVQGQLIAGGTIDAAIGRHTKHRTQMAIRPDGKPARTHYRILQRFRAHTQLALQLDTGRTHQIRVHMAHIRHPIVGDPLYNKQPRIPPKSSLEFITALRSFKRQALHAYKLTLTHPNTHDVISWEAPVPDDMQQLLHHLDKDEKSHHE